MSGPTLQLNITAPGQKSVEGSVSAVERLAAALRDLPKASAELLKLQKALSGAQAPSGLKSGAGDLKELVGEIKNLGAQLNNSFGSLEETIKKGWGKAAAAQAAGEAKLKSSSGAVKGRTFTSTGTDGQPVEVPAAWFAKMQVGAEKIKAANLNAAQAEALSIEAAAARVEAATQRADARLQARYTKRFEKEAQDRINLQVNSAKMAEAARMAAEKESLSIEAAAARVEAAHRAANARYAAMSTRGQASAVLGARSALDQPGANLEDISKKFGPNVTALAQQHTFASAAAKVHTLEIEGLGKAMSTAHSAARGLASGFGQMALTWGQIGPLLAGAAISHSFVQSIKIGSGVQQELETIRVLSQESGLAVSQLETQLISLGQTGTFGPAKIAEAMKILSLAGLSIKEVGLALKPSLDLAVTGGVSIEKAAETLTAVGTAYRYSAGNFSGVADQISQAAAASMSSVESMAESFRSSSVIAQAYGVTLKDTATGLAALANLGIKGSAAGTALRQGYSELSGATSKTRKALEGLGVNIVDETGRMKSLLDMTLSLSTALDKLSGPERLKAIQSIANQRGSKFVVATLSAFEEEAKATPGSSATKELVRLRELQEQAAGFNAIASSQLAVTSEGLMKGVVSSFQTALVQAFKEIEPTLTVVAVRMREIFNDPSFKDGITTLVNGVSAFTQVLVDHVSWLKYLALAYAGFKGLQVLQLGLSTAAVAVALYGTAATAAAVPVAAVAVGSAGLGAATGAAILPVTGLAAATTLLGTALKFAGPLAVLLTVVTLGYQLYSSAQKDSTATERDAAKLKSGLTLKSLEDEEARLRLVEVELRKGTDARLADIVAMEQQAVAAAALAAATARAPLAKAASDASSKFPAAKQAYESAGNLGPGGEMIVKGRYMAVLGEVEKAQDALAAYDRQVETSAAAVANAQARVKGRQKVNDDLEEERRNKRWKYDKAKADADAAEAAAKVARISAGPELSVNKADYQAQMARDAKKYANEKKLLDEQHKYKLVTDAEYAYKSEQIAEAQYAEELRILEQFVQKSRAQLALLAAEKDPKKRAKAAKEQLGISGTLEAAEEELRMAKQLAAIRLEGSGARDSRKLDADLAKLAKKGAADAALLELDQRRLEMDPRLVAYEEAAIKRAGDYTEVLQAEAAALALVQQHLALARQGGSGDDLDTSSFLYDPKKAAALAAEEAQRKARQVRIEDAQSRSANQAGEAAYSKKNLELVPAWKKQLIEWQDAMKVMTSTRDDFMNGWVERGRTMWGEFLKTGKISLKSLGDLVMNTLADITYKRFISQPFAQAGEGIFDNVLKLAMTPSAGGVSQDARSMKGDNSGTSDAMQSLRTAAGDLSSSFQNLGSSAWKMLMEFGQGLAATLSGSGGGGGWASAIAGMFGGSGGGNNIPAGSDVVASTAWAKGGAFYSGVHAFANGGVVDRPNYFKFGKGAANLGVMGEAGPEAILPLARGADGNLGVRTQGGGGATNVTVASKTMVVIENHSGGPEPEVQTQTQPNGDEMIRVVIKAAAKDMSTGGPLRKAARSSGSLPRY